MVFDPRERPEYLPDWWPWLPDLLPDWWPLSPEFNPEDWIPGKPSWWPDWLPWNPFNIKLPENVRTQYSRAETTVYLQALSVQRALYSHRIASRLKSGPVITRNLISNPYPKPPKK